MVNIEGLTREQVLQGLYNGSQPQGLGFIHYTPEGMTIEQARELLTRGCHFDYLQGRVMKVSLREGATEFNEYGYDRDNGAGAAQRVVDAIRAGDAQVIAEQHQRNTERSARETLHRAETEVTYMEGNTLHLGLADHENNLRKNISEKLPKRS